MMHLQETSGRYRAVEPEQWLQRHPEAGSLWDARPPTPPDGEAGSYSGGCGRVVAQMRGHIAM